MNAIEEDHLPRLSKWELSFFESIKDQFERKGFLSEAQADKLEQIWVKLP